MNQHLLTPADTHDYYHYAATHGFGDFHVKIDPTTGMQAIIAIHSTKLGPALGGCRFIEYPHYQDAFYDALRLARGMSYKAALVNLPLGGGKSVIIKPQGTFDRQAYFDKFGQFVQEMNGRYITALDSGTLLEDMDRIALLTPYVASRSSHGDPSPATAEGIFLGIKTAVQCKLGKSSLKNLDIAIQGLGHVGYQLAQLLHAEQAHLTIADVNQTTVNRFMDAFGASSAPTASIHRTACDVFVPCALGSVLNNETIPELQAPIVAGAANNQLAHAYHGQQLHDRGILYAPDYVINAGGLIYAANQYFGGSVQEFKQKLENIGDSLFNIFTRSRQENQPTSAIADRLAEEKLA